MRLILKKKQTKNETFTGKVARLSPGVELYNDVLGGGETSTRHHCH